MSLANVATGVTPPLGTYVIYHRILNPTGQKLAISFNGPSANATVKPLEYTTDQLWRLTKYDGVRQSLRPITNATLQAAWGTPGDVVAILPGASFTWTFQSTAEGYTIRDGGALLSAWALNNQTNGSTISIVPTNNTALEQKWILELQD